MKIYTIFSLRLPGGSRGLSVQAMSRYVEANRLGDPVTDGQPLRKPAANIRGRYINQRCVHPVYPLVDSRHLLLNSLDIDGYSGPADNCEPGERQDALRVAAMWERWRGSWPR